jgi:hypothetical protein
VKDCGGAALAAVQSACIFLQEFEKGAHFTERGGLRECNVAHRITAAVVFRDVHS